MRTPRSDRGSATRREGRCSVQHATKVVHRGLMWGALLLSAACKEPNRPPAPPSGEQRLADRYPCDQGVGSDPDVVWHENFEEGSVPAVIARYNDHKNPSGMALVADRPASSCGAASIQFTSDGRIPTTQATDLNCIEAAPQLLEGLSATNAMPEGFLWSL